MNTSDPRSTTPIEVAIITPVYNDWISFDRLLHDLDRIDQAEPFQLHIIAVDDASVQPRPKALADSRFDRIASIRFVRLVCNLGHQRAIAVGLCVACGEKNVQAIIVMDCDGEDLPADVPRLLALARANPGSVICAQRRGRSESRWFKTFYRIYKVLFKAMTGASIDFGNFTLMPPTAATAIVHHPSTWNHLAATLTRTRLPMVRLPTVRGRRYAGSSHMNLVALILHGLSAISVYSDVLMVRVIIALLIVSGAATLALIATVAIRVFTDLAIPGWASFMGSSLIIILLQSLIFSFLLIFMALNQRSIKPMIPALDAKAFIESEIKTNMRASSNPQFIQDRDVRVADSSRSR